MRYALWFIQILLAVLFLSAGGAKMVQPSVWHTHCAGVRAFYRRV